jgi:hypothetical protein
MLRWFTAAQGSLTSRQDNRSPESSSPSTVRSYLLTVPINDLSRASELTVNRATAPASSISFSNQFERMACNPHKENGDTNSARLGSRSFVSYIRSLASFAATDEECR